MWVLRYFNLADLKQIQLADCQSLYYARIDTPIMHLKGKYITMK